MTIAKPRQNITLPRRRATRAPLEQRARPTAERMRRARGYFERGDTGQITMRDSPIERAMARNVITSDQYTAAQKYRHHWYYGGLHDHLGSLDLTRLFSSDHSSASGMPRSENEAFHRQQYREAVEALGKIGSYVLDSAVCREVPLEHVGYALGWDNRGYATGAAAERLKIALDVLCKLWGIGSPP